MQYDYLTWVFFWIFNIFIFFNFSKYFACFIFWHTSFQDLKISPVWCYQGQAIYPNSLRIPKYKKKSVVTSAPCKFFWSFHNFIFNFIKIFCSSYIQIPPLIISQYFHNFSKYMFHLFQNILFSKYLPSFSKYFLPFQNISFSFQNCSLFFKIFRTSSGLLIKLFW